MDIGLENPQKAVKYKCSIWRSYTTSWHVSKGLHHTPGTALPKLIATLLTKIKQPKCPPTDEWMTKIWYIYTM